MVFHQFLSLPWIPQDLILRNFTPVDIFNFSLISKKSHSLAKRAKIRVESVDWNLQKDKEQLTLRTHSSASTVCIDKTNEGIWMPLKPEAFEAEIDGIRIGVYYSFNESSLIICNPVRLEDNLCEVVFTRFCELLKVGTFNLECHNMKIPPYIFNLTQCFHKLSIGRGVTLTDEEARVLLKVITVDQLTFDPSISFMDWSVELVVLLLKNIFHLN